MGMEAQLDECGGRLLLGDNRELSRLAAVDWVPEFWSLVFTGLPCMCIFYDLLYSFPTFPTPNLTCTVPSGTLRNLASVCATVMTFVQNTLIAT